jgi:hypothetical protein
MTFREATLDPIDEFKKFTASLLTPTTRPKTPNPKRIIIEIQ